MREFSFPPEARACRADCGAFLTSGGGATRLQLVAFVPRVSAVEVLDCDFRIRTQTPTDTSGLQTQSASQVYEANSNSCRAAEVEVVASSATSMSAILSVARPALSLKDFSTHRCFQ
jgi:hypothetical protein